MKMFLRDTSGIFQVFLPSFYQFLMVSSGNFTLNVQVCLQVTLGYAHVTVQVVPP